MITTKPASWLKNEINFVVKQYKKGFGRGTIAKLFYEKFGYIRTPDSIKHCLQLYTIGIDQDIKKVLILDIETAPIQAYVWGLFDQNVGINMIKADWYVLSWTAKWIDEEKVSYQDQRNKKGASIENDKEILKPLWKMINEADIVITQNGVKFDMKKLNSRFLIHGLGMPDPYKNIDTLKLAKKYFSFTSNKLEYMSAKFNTTYKKQDHREFPGFELWKGCLAGNIKAWNCMKSYNQYDVLATEELFLKLSEFDKTETTRQALLAYESRKTKKVK